MATGLRRRLQTPLRFALRPLAIRALRGSAGELVMGDAEACRSQRSMSTEPGVDTVVRALIDYPESRSILYHRLAYADRVGKVMASAYRMLLKPQVSLEISCPDIGPGFVIVHGAGSYIYATRIGRDVTVMQQVTLGRRSEGFPSIGDGAFIAVGAKVIGDVHVGTCAKVGANAVVVADVPDHATAVGIPARIIDGPPRYGSEHAEPRLPS